MGKKEERPEKCDRFGLHRVLDAKRSLPQAAERLDNSLPIYPTEALIEVERLNIDAASFVQMEKETGGNAEAIGKIIFKNTQERGKQHNAVTGSGGMLVGTVTQVGSAYAGPIKVKEGTRVATLVSLTLTPLRLQEIRKVHLKAHQVEVKGQAVLFSSSIFTPMPKDIEETVALAAFDVAGAPAMVSANCKSGQTLVVVGAGGKAGILSCVAGRKKVGTKGKVIAIEPFAKAAADLQSLGVCDAVLQIDATDPVAVHSGVSEATRGKMGDVVINVASVPGTENSSLLSARQGKSKKSKVIFFSMATSFTRVALGAEGIAADCELIFGNGYYPGHAEFAVNLLRKNKRLKALFVSRYQN
jgi:L-erythro-3,5-diaminohexanoate dehydrogenase